MSTLKPAGSEAPRSLSKLQLAAPIAGWATVLEEVPDPAFAQRMVGDGIAVDPTSAELRSPCDGVVLTVHASRHACTLRTQTGAEILLHVGIDTVGLRGEGFTVHVREGQTIRTGEPLISFDMDLLARKARSLMTVMVVANGDAYTVTHRVQDRAVVMGEPLLEVSGGEFTAAAETSTETAECQVRLLIPHGLHARPAAAFVRHARPYPGSVHVALKGRSVNGKSVVALMGLGAHHGDMLTLTVRGERAGQVVQELAEQVSLGLGDTLRPIAEATPLPEEKPQEAVAASQPFAPGTAVMLKGTLAAPGLAVGQAVRVHEEEPKLSQKGRGVQDEERRLAEALAGVRRDIEVMLQTEGAGSAARKDIFQAHLALLDDPEFTGAAGQGIAIGQSAEWAWKAAIETHVQVLHGLSDPLLKERMGDLRDIGRRVIAFLTGQGGTRVPAELPPDAILVANELLPSDLAAVPPGRLAALCTARGGPTSHVAILAAGMGIPAVVALGDAALRIPTGTSLIVNGDRGELHVHPPEAAREATLGTLRTRASRRKTDLATAHEACHTADGVRIEVFANLGRPGDAAAATAQGAEGCGLLRSEFLFLERLTAPTEDEQAAQYQEIADALQNRPLIIRTLDVGGDKPLAYLPLPAEENPVLGLRGVRVSLRYPELLRTQVRAILRVKPLGVCRILVPMITSAHELQAVRTVVEAECRELGITSPVHVGAMIEVPAAAVLSDRLAAQADFLSIGTNDLTQYALAMDRGNAYLAPQLDSLHPGVLRLVAQTVEGARKHGRPVAVCGGIASDPQAAPLLIGLGVTELSATPAVIPGLKAFIRTLTLPQCQEAARQALELATGDEVRALVTSKWQAQ
ncbi:phosphoenolpyruvate--protein phosphotransferase [Stigmatella aurantiaca]|uniref:phosphoenolpyruvate--protein phosphotransferase n=2 Tax=Stigmatella aurantiaca (strain DW4/3-1) TaxID=378806 RepID=Q099V4_STIAD|nr:phosphoenolpyruvate--protein phosphotransferase [Stigmatella aurantiaca]EAU68529.1 multiphosphoryl transfer protein (MTP) [Stigmatella aurantiaca DW4/3-1]